MATKKAAPVVPVVSLISVLKEDLSLSPFPVQFVGFNKLKRSLIPKDDGERVTFYLDKQTALDSSILALKLGITTDELFRRFCWSFLSHP